MSSFSTSAVGNVICLSDLRPSQLDNVSSLNFPRSFMDIELNPISARSMLRARFTSVAP